MSRSRYVSQRYDDHREVIVETSWDGDGSGMLPPPVVEFFEENGRSHKFIYAGPED